MNEIKKALVYIIIKAASIPISILLAVFVMVALWTSGGSGSRREF